METREIIVAILIASFSIGAAAMTQFGATVFPHHENLIFWIGLILAALASFGLLVLIVTPNFGRRASVAKQTTKSTTALAEGGGKIILEDSHSTAEVLAHARENASITGRNIVHTPSSSAGSRETD